MGGNSKPSIVLFTQIKLLSCVGMMYCGNEHLAEAAKSYHSELVFFCNSEWVKPSKEIPQNAINDEQVVVLWKAWREAETKRRTGYCVWVCLMIHLLGTANLLSAVGLHVGLSFRYSTYAHIR